MIIIRIIGITGGIGSGKSTVDKYISSLGFKIIDCDILANNLYNDEKFINFLKNSPFSSAIISGDKVDKSLVSEIAFLDKNKLKILQDYMWKDIFMKVKEEISLFNQEHIDGVIFVDAPVLFESGLDKEIPFDAIFTVYVTRDVQLDRLMRRGKGMSRKKANSIIEKQISSKERCGRSDFIIDNNRDLSSLYTNINKALKTINL